MLADFMHNNAAASVVDVGCGDWQFSRVMDWSGIRYQGFYLVDTVIDISKHRFARDNTTFATMRGISDLTNADLLVCKDVLRYFPNKDVSHYLDYFSTYYNYAIVIKNVLRILTLIWTYLMEQVVHFVSVKRRSTEGSLCWCVGRLHGKSASVSSMLACYLARGVLRLQMQSAVGIA